MHLMSTQFSIDKSLHQLQHDDSFTTPCEHCTWQIFSPKGMRLQCRAQAAMMWQIAQQD